MNWDQSRLPEVRACEPTRQDVIKDVRVASSRDSFLLPPLASNDAPGDGKGAQTRIARPIARFKNPKNSGRST